MKKLFLLACLLVSINLSHAKNYFADPYASGDYVSVSSGTWATAATWKVYNGTDLASSPVASAAPTTTTGTTINVWIDGGFTVTVTAATACLNLHVINGVLKNGGVCNGTNTPLGTIRVYGTVIEVTTNGTVGNGVGGADDDNADAISFTIYNTGTTTITGTGGTIDLSKLIIGSAASTLTGTVIVDHDMKIHYHGSTFGGNAFGLYPVGTAATNSFTLTINAGKTLTIGKWSGVNATGSSHSAPNTSFNINVNGTLIFEPGRPIGNTATYGFAASGTAGNSYLALNSGTTFTSSLNVGSTGTVTLPEFYPNSSLTTGLPGNGTVSTITVAAGGVLNIDSIADFRKAAQTITGGGTVNIRAGALLKIGNHSGITASAASGTIQTTTRNFSTLASYAYVDTTVQATGDGLPATVKKLYVSNTQGLTLTNHLLNITDSLTLTAGIFSVNTGDSVIVKSGKLVSANSLAYVETKVNTSTGAKAVLGIEAIAASVATLFPIGTNGNYLPVTVTPDATSAFYATAFNGATTDGTANGTALSASLKSSSVDAIYFLNRSPLNTNAYTLKLGYNTALKGASFINTNPVYISNYSSSAWTITAGTNVDSAVSASVTKLGAFYVTNLATALPVTFISISASTLAGNSAKVSWAVGTETNISSYIIEKSTDGVSFSAAGTITATGASTYNFVDVNATAAVTYYRVKAIEKSNGSGTYSPVALLKKSAITTASIGVYPNPVKTNQLNLQLSNLQAGKVTISLYNNDGRQVMVKLVDYAGGNLTQVVNLSSSIKAGIYRLYVNDGSNTLTQSVIIAQ